MSDFVRPRTRDLLRLEQEMQASERVGDRSFSRLRASLAGKPDKLALVSILATKLFEAGQLMAQLDDADEDALSAYVDYNVEAGQLEQLWLELGASSR